MLKLLKLLGVILLLMLVTSLALIAWTNFYISRPDFIEKIRQSSSNLLEAEITFSHPDIAIWSGFQADQVTLTRYTQDNKPASTLKIDHLRISYNPLALFQQKIQIRKLEIRNPSLRLLQNPDGFWDIPDINRLTSKLSTPFFEIGDRRFQILLDQVLISDAHLTAIQNNQEDLLTLHGASLNGSFSINSSFPLIDASLDLETIRIADAFPLNNLSATLSTKNKTLIFNNISAETGEGIWKAELAMDISEKPSTYQLKAELRDMKLEDLILQLHPEQALRPISGILNLKASLKGNLKRVTLGKGEGTLTIRNPDISTWPPMLHLFKELHLTDHSLLKFPEMAGTFKIEDEKLTFYELHATSDAFTISGSGSFNIHQKIDFDTRVTFDPDLLSTSPPHIREKLDSHPDGIKSLTFNVSGTLDNISSNLHQKLPTETETSSQNAPHE